MLLSMDMMTDAPKTTPCLYCGKPISLDGVLANGPKGVFCSVGHSRKFRKDFLRWEMEQREHESVHPVSSPEDMVASTARAYAGLHGWQPTGERVSPNAWVFPQRLPDFLDVSIGATWQPIADHNKEPDVQLYDNLR
jgi:hypothetical protein